MSSACPIALHVKNQSSFFPILLVQIAQDSKLTDITDIQFWMKFIKNIFRKHLNLMSSACPIALHVGNQSSVFPNLLVQIAQDSNFARL